MIRASLHHSALNSRDIALMLAVAEEGSIRRAADALGIAQPSLSKSIRLIEQRLGVNLFERSTSGAQPTPVGGDLLARGRQVLLDLAAIQRDLRDSLSGDAGDVRVGIGSLVAPLITAPAVQSLRADYPDLRLDLRQLHPHDIVPQVGSGALDFGICHLEDVAVPPSLHGRIVCRMPVVFFVRSGHPLARLAVVRPAQLAGYPLTLPHSYSRLEAWFCAFTGASCCTVATRCHDFDLAGEIVAHSDDVSITSPDTLDRIRRRFDVVPLTLAGVDFMHEVQCVVPAARPLSVPAQRVRGVLEGLLDLISERAPVAVCSGALARLRSREAITL